MAGDRAVAVGTSDYDAVGGAPARTYYNAWLLEFDGEGRCRSFVEYYNLQRREPAGGLSQCDGPRIPRGAPVNEAFTAC